MRATAPKNDWKVMVLRSMTPPAWLSGPAFENDVVISSRMRMARNLTGFRFTHLESDDRLRDILAAVMRAAEPLHCFQRLSKPERDFWVGARFISPDFAIELPGRALFVNSQRTMSLMVNEEDHLRIQGLTGGWSLPHAIEAADQTHEHLASSLSFAKTPQWGYLTASPFNAGSAQRVSALFHLVGLAHAKRLPKLCAALTSSGLIVRGVFGESSRPIGAFFQVSTTKRDLAAFIGSCEYLIQQERQCRADIPAQRLKELTKSAVEFAVSSREIDLANALRVIAYVRAYCASTGAIELQEIDRTLSTLEVHGRNDPSLAARDRTRSLRTAFESLLKD